MGGSWKDEQFAFYDPTEELQLNSSSLSSSSEKRWRVRIDLGLLSVLSSLVRLREESSEDDEKRRREGKGREREEEKRNTKAEEGRTEAKKPAATSRTRASVCSYLPRGTTTGGNLPSR